MRILEEIKCMPFEKALLPGLLLDIGISYKKYHEVIVGMIGWIKTDDGMILSDVNETLLDETRPLNEIRARDTKFDPKFVDTVHKTKLIVLLDRRSLAYIEKRRMEDKKRDVRLLLQLKVKSLVNKASISHIHEIPPREVGIDSKMLHLGSNKRQDWNLLVYANDPDFSASRLNCWLLSGTGDPSYLGIAEQTMSTVITIRSSDWIHDFTPKLGLGDHFIVEIPINEKTIQNAWSYIGKAEESFRQWNTKGCYANCREAGTLIDRNLADRLGKNSFLYRERWGQCYQRFNHLASLDLHLEDIKKSTKYPSEDVKISRADVEQLILATKLILKYAGDLLEESKNKIN